MTHAEFDAHLERIFEEMRNLGVTKGIEYAGDADRFDNFNSIADETGIPRITVAWIYLAKHMRAIASYVRSGRVLSESIHGRIRDAQLYLALIDGMIHESGHNSGGVADEPVKTFGSIALMHNDAESDLDCPF